MITRWDLEELYHEEDNELMHYGVKGMHWGKHLPGIDALNAAVAKARAGAANLRNELNGTNAYNRGVAEAQRRNKNIDLLIRQTQGNKNMTTEGKGRTIKDLKARQTQNTLNATGTNAKRAAYENSIEGKLKKFASNTLKSLKYDAGKTGKSISKTLSSYGKKTLNSIKGFAGGFLTGKSRTNLLLTKGVKFKKNTPKSMIKGYDTGVSARKKVNSAAETVSKTARKAYKTVSKKAKSARDYGSGVTGNSIVKSLTNSSYRKGNLAKRNAMDRIQNVANRVGYRTKKQKRISRANSAINRYYSGR